MGLRVRVLFMVSFYFFSSHFLLQTGGVDGWRTPQAAIQFAFSIVQSARSELHVVAEFIRFMLCCVVCCEFIRLL